jgi:hypothetical protein
MRGGKISELEVATACIKEGLSVFLPLVDDEAVDMVVRLSGGRHYDKQVKSCAGYNRIIGLPWQFILDDAADNYILVVAYRFPDKPSDFYYLTVDDLRGDTTLRPEPLVSSWGDLIFNKPQRDRYIGRRLDALATYLKDRSEPEPASGRRPTGG